MREYPKIQSIFKRREAKPRYFIEGEWSVPEFEYLQHVPWLWTEKIDGTNVRIQLGLDLFALAGRTDAAELPLPLAQRLMTMFFDKRHVLPHSVVLFGEGYGVKIQSGGKYIPDGVAFILFDVRVGDWWLRRPDIEDVAAKLGCRTVPVVGQGTLHEAIAAIKTGVKSTFGDFLAEGLVLRPLVDLRYRDGEPILTKIKHKDFALQKD